MVHCCFMYRLNNVVVMMIKRVKHALFCRYTLLVFQLLLLIADVVYYLPVKTINPHGAGGAGRSPGHRATTRHNYYFFLATL